MVAAGPELDAIYERLRILERRRLWGFLIVIAAPVAVVVAAIAAFVLLSSASVVVTVSVVLGTAAVFMVVGQTIVVTARRARRRLAEASDRFEPLLRLPVRVGERFGLHRITEAERDRFSATRLLGYLPLASMKMLAVVIPLATLVWLYPFPPDSGRVVGGVISFALLGLFFAVRPSPLRWSIVRDQTGTRLLVDSVWLGFLIRTREVATADVGTLFRREGKIGVFPLDRGGVLFRFVMLLRIWEEVPRSRTARIEQEIGTRLGLERNLSYEKSAIAPDRETASAVTFVTWVKKGPDATGGRHEAP